MKKEHFDLSVGKKILSDSEFQSRASKELSGNVRTDLKIKVYDFSAPTEAEALAIVLEHSPSFPEQDEKDRYIFRVDRQELQELVDSLYDLVKYEKSPKEPE